MALFSFSTAAPKETTLSPFTSATPAVDKSVFDLEKALRDSLAKMDSTLLSTSRLDRIIQSAAQQIHDWAKANPETLANDPAATTPLSGETQNNGETEVSTKPVTEEKSENETKQTVDGTDETVEKGDATNEKLAEPSTADSVA